MAESKDKSKVKKPVKATIPPRSTLPPRAGSAFGRPMAATPAQREKRRSGRPSGTINAKKTANEGEIMLFGSIGQDWFGEGITAVSFDEQLKSLGSVETIRLRINSGGGDVFEATAIYNMLVKSEAHVIVEIEGVAASAATLISMAGDEVRISENAHFMIHAASGVAWGNAEQIRQYLKLLDNADGLIRTTYAAKTGMDDAELAEMMSYDNWMTAQEALDNGFVDAIDGVKKVKPHVTPEDSITPKHIGNLTDDRLAAFGGYLSTLAAAVCPTKQEPGDSPQVVPLSTKESKMNAKLRAKCLAAGMPESLNGDAANEWLEANFDKVMAPAAVAVLEQPAPKPSDDEKLMNLIEAREKKRLDARKSWRKEVDANIALAFGEHAPTGLKEQCYDLEDDGDARIDGIRAKIQAAKAAEDQKIKDGGVRISFDRVQPRDNYKAAIKSGLMVRALTNAAGGNGSLEKHLPEKDRAKDYQDFTGMPLVKIAEHCLIADGWRDDTVRRLSPAEIAQAALGFGRQIGIRNDAGLQTTGSLAEITRDAMNKVLTTAYNEAPQTWRTVGRQGASVADFKDKHVVKLSGAQNVPIWNDNTAPELAKLSNEKEKYAVEARAETLSFSWRLIVNDDMDALSRRPQIAGNAMARTVNAVFWAEVTANRNMTDGVALYAVATGARKQDNLITGAASPSNSTIGSMRKLMRLMRGLNSPEGTQSDDILNLTPKYLVGPAALEEAILKQCLSGADPASGGNSAVYNSSRVLIPVIEPLLDASSTTAFYVFADPATIDTIELSFMQGQETPYVHEWMDDRTMAQNFTILQSFAAKAIEWRSSIKHAGA